MDKPTRQIMDELDEQDSCLCLNEHSCCIVYGYKPIVKYTIQPVMNKVFKPIGRGLKKMFFSCAMLCDSCSFGCVNINGEE